MKTLEFIKLNESGSKQRSSIFATTISRLPSVLHQSPRFPLEYQRT